MCVKKSYADHSCFQDIAMYHCKGTFVARYRHDQLDEELH